MVVNLADLLNGPAHLVHGKAPCFTHGVCTQVDPWCDLFADGGEHPAHGSACDRLGAALPGASIPVALALEQPHILRVLTQPSVDHRLCAGVDREGSRLTGLAFNEAQFGAVGIQCAHVLGP